MSTKQVRYVPPSERAAMLLKIFKGERFTVIEFAAAYKLLHDTARKQLERETKQGLYTKTTEGRDVFYCKAVTR